VFFFFFNKLFVLLAYFQLEKLRNEVRI